jgi:hypothetical protein
MKHGIKPVLLPVTALHVPADYLQVRKAAGVGRENGKDYPLEVNDKGEMMVRLPDRSWVMFDWKGVATAAANFDEQEGDDGEPTA